MPPQALPAIGPGLDLTGCVVRLIGILDEAERGERDPMEVIGLAVMQSYLILRRLELHVERQRTPSVN